MKEFERPTVEIWKILSEPITGQIRGSDDGMPQFSAVVGPDIFGG